MEANHSEKNLVRVDIRFGSDGFILAGDLHLPSKSNPPVVVGSHGLFADRSSPKQIALAEACNRVGIAYFRFDHRGCGDSEGGPEERCSFEARCRDLSNACATVRDRDDCGDGIALFGSSLGGAAVCRVSSSAKPSSVVVFAAPTSSRCIFEAVERLEEADECPAYFYENLAFDNSPRLPALAGVLVVHGELDEVVPVSEGRGIYEAAKQPKQLNVQENGDHRMSDPEHQKAFVRTAVDWFEKGFERK